MTPPEAELGSVTLTDQPLKWSHHVRNFATEVIEITKVESDVAELTATVRPGNHDHEYYVELSLAPTVAKGPLRGKVTLHTNSPKTPTIEVPLVLTIQ